MERQSKFIENLSNSQVNLLNKLFQFKVDGISWDYDQILVNLEVPVKEHFLEVTGLDYRDRKVDQWLALSHWAEMDGYMSFEEVKKIESPIWEDPEVLQKAKPIIEFQTFSYLAHKHGISQSIITTRIPKLRDATFQSVKENYPWIESNRVFIRNDDKTSGDSFKGVIIDALNPDIHFEDSIFSTREILRLSNVTVFLFPRFLESNQFQGNEKVIEFPDVDMWSKFSTTYKLPLSIVSHNVIDTSLK